LTKDTRTYEAAGVSLSTADAVVERLRAAVESTGATDFGRFAGLFPLDEHRFLAASTDSVGSKLMLHRRAGTLRWGGMDLAAHCIDDVLCSGAEPLFLLDYVAAAHVDLEQVAELVEGAAEVCRAAGCALIGGETAELPGVYRDQELDFAGTCVGIVERDRVIDGSRCAPGDVVVGFPSSGLHTNGFSLVRTLGEIDPAFLAPHRLYLDDVHELRAHADVKALAHATGGGILGMGAAAGVRVARRPRRRRGGGATRLQPRHRHVRRRPGSACRLNRDRSAGVIGVLVSGQGTNLQALLDAGLPIVAVASNRRDAPALRRVPEEATAVFDLADYADRDARDAAMAAWLKSRGVQIVVLAGYMHVLTPAFLDGFPEAVVNVHPSLLPDFPGMHAVEEQLAAGVSESGATVHIVDEGVDSGPVLAQERVPVLPDDTPSTLHERIQDVEHRLLPKVVAELCAR